MKAAQCPNCFSFNVVKASEKEGTHSLRCALCKTNYNVTSPAKERAA